MQGNLSSTARFATAMAASLLCGILTAPSDAALVTVRLGPSMAGAPAVVRFDLVGIPKGAAVHRAELRVSRTAELDGNCDEAMTDIEIYPLTAAAGTPAAEGAPLALSPPWYDSLDATEAVRAWVGGKPNGGFFVKACPAWNTNAVALHVGYEGVPGKVPPQATALKAFHRAGQTFLTWREIGEPAGKDELTWKELKALIGEGDRTNETRYVVYRSDRRITPETLPRAERLAVVRPLSCWNANGRCIERPLDLAISTLDGLPSCGKWNPFGGASVDGAYGQDCPMDRFAIRDGEPPLPRGTGLYVHTAAKAEKAYYAVVTAVDGVENTVALSDANALAVPLAEAPGEPEPVRQKEMPRLPGFDYPCRHWHYVHWVAAPYGNLPYQYYNLSVYVPEEPDAAMPLEVSLHRDGNSYWRTMFRMERNSVVLCPHDFPVRTWWYGHHEALGTLRSFRQGVIQPYTERRLLANIAWAARTWPIDRNRIVIAGMRGSSSAGGALHLGLRHPEIFSLAASGHGAPAYAATARDPDPKGDGSAMRAIWGKPDWNLKTDAGKDVWDELDLHKLVAATPPAADLPMVTLSGRNPAPLEFYKLLLEGGRPVIGHFAWGGARYLPVSATQTFPNVARLDIRRNRSMLGISSPGALAIASGTSRDRVFNQDIFWRDIVDEPARYEVTLYYEGSVFFEAGRAKPIHVTLRRLQQFKVAANQPFHYTLKGFGPKDAAIEGDIAAGKDGLLTLRALNIGGAARLTITPKG